MCGSMFRRGGIQINISKIKCIVSLSANCSKCCLIVLLGICKTPGCGDQVLGDNMEIIRNGKERSYILKIFA